MAATLSPWEILQRMEAATRYGASSATLLALIEDLEDAIMGWLPLARYDHHDNQWRNVSSYNPGLLRRLCTTALESEISDVIHADVIRLTQFQDFDASIRPTKISPVTALKLVECGLLQPWYGKLIFNHLSPAALKAACGVWQKTQNFVDPDSSEERAFVFYVAGAHGWFSEAERLDLLDWLTDNFSNDRFVRLVLEHAIGRYDLRAEAAVVALLRRAIACWGRKNDVHGERAIYYNLTWTTRELDHKKYWPFFGKYTVSEAAMHVDRLADQSYCDSSQLGRWRVSRALRIMAMIVLVADGYLTATGMPAAGLLMRQRRAAAARTRRFFTIATQLPMELQVVLACRAVGSSAVSLSYRGELTPDFALRWALNIWRPINPDA